MRSERQRAEQIEALLQAVAEFPDPRMRATTQELIQELLDLYGEALARTLELTSHATAAGDELIKTFASDGLLSSLFLLHGLHPVDLEQRIARALTDVQPYLKSHGGSVELLKVEDGVAYLRLLMQYPQTDRTKEQGAAIPLPTSQLDPGYQGKPKMSNGFAPGSCHACPTSTVTLKQAIEEAIYRAAPDLDGLRIEGLAETGKLPGTPVTFVPRRRQKPQASAEQEDGYAEIEAR